MPAVERRLPRTELQRRLDELRATATFRPGSEEEFLLRYNLARAYLAALSKVIQGEATAMIPGPVSAVSRWT